jgi:dihydrofolate reductase
MPDAHSSRRPRCSVFIAMSVDGFIAPPDGSLGWLSVVEQPGEDYGYAQFFESIDTVVVGRKTYEVALGFENWPYAGKRCIVLTHRPAAPKRGAEFFDGTPDALVERLGREAAKHVYVDGAAVIQQFLAAGLVDALTLSIVPVVLGDGISLFGKSGAERSLALREARAFPSGLARLVYDVR